MLDDIVTVAVLTGFLGSGKSTLLNGLLRSGRLSQTAVIVNEMGEIGIDNLLIEQVVEGVTLLKAGCLCCAVRSDLEQTLRDLRIKQLRGVVPQFTHIVIETTGLAKPSPILQTLMSQPVRELRYQLSTVVTTVDAIGGSATLRRFSEARQQVAVADRIAITKTDLGSRSDIECLRCELRALNSVLPVCVRLDNADPEEVLGTRFLRGGTGDLSPENSPSGMRLKWYPAAMTPGGFSGNQETQHSSGIRADSYFVARPIEWERFQSALKNLMRHRGSELLRFKAITQLEGVEQPVVLQAVHHTFYPPEVLQGGWPDGRRVSQLVFITQGTEREIIDSFVQTVAGETLGDYSPRLSSDGP
jgi:G3E family GTPase